MRVPDGFPPEILGPWCCPYAGSRRIPSRSFGSMTLSLCGFPTGSLHKFWVHDVVLMRVPDGFPPQVLGPWRCPYAGSQPVPSRNFGSMTLSLCGFPAGSLQKFWVHDVVLMRVPDGFPPQVLGPWRCPYAGSQRVPSTSFGSMTLSLCGFPTGALHKAWGHDVVRMRGPSGFPPQILGPCCFNPFPNKNANLTSTQTPANATKPTPKKSFNKIWSANQLHSTYLTIKIKSHSLKNKNSASNQNQHQTQNRTTSKETTSKSSPIQSAPTQSNPIQSNPTPYPTKFWFC